MALAARVTILAFGSTSLAAGLSSLIRPTASLESLNLPPDALPSLRANALASIAISVYYVLAAYQNNVAFFAATVPMRLLSAAVFWRQGWNAVALWEGLGSVTTAVALGWYAVRRESRQRSSCKKQT